MAQDLRKLKDQAQALFLKGKYEKALAFYHKIVEADPKDIKVWVRIGDLYRKAKRPEQAIDIYAKAARAFAVSGFLMQAISVSKMILEIDPDHRETQNALTELYAKKEGIRPATAAVVGTGAPSVGGNAVSAASMAMLEQLKKKSAVDMPPKIQPPAPPLIVPEVALDSVEIIVDEEEIQEAYIQTDLDDVNDLLEDADGGSGDRGIRFDELDINTADDLFDSIMRQEEVDLSTHDSAASLVLPDIPLFSSLEPEEFSAILDQLSLRRFDVGDRIIREGERGDAFYIIARGRADVRKKDPSGKEIQVATLEEGQFFGEFAYFNESERHASVIVREQMNALEIDREGLSRITEQYPRIREVLRDFYRERLLNSLFAISPLFQPFSPEEKRELIRQFEPKSYDAGSIIIRQGTEGQGLFLILAGQVVVNVKALNGEMHEVALLSEGSFFGEISLIEESSTTANCLAADDTEVFWLPRKAFKELVMMHPRLLDVVAEFSEKRKASTDRLVADGHKGMAEAGIV